MAFLEVPPPCTALLKERETQHTERSGVQRSVVEVSGFTKNHQVDLANFLGSSISHQPHITEISTNPN
jgi:hypothetical protein